MTGVRGPRAGASEKRRKRYAHEQVFVARLQGRLVPGPCEHVGPDCLGVINGHHRNGYANPLDVVWLCARHHQYEHHAAKGDVA